MSAPAAPRPSLLVGGSPEPSSVGLVRELAELAGRVVAVDRGAEVLEAAGIRPWAFVGDADSVSAGALRWATGAAEVVQLHPVLKDATDLTLALELVGAEAPPADGATPVSPGCLVTCVSGGRLDHQLGVVGALIQAAPLAPVLVEDALTAWLLSGRGRSELRLGAAHRGRTLSVLALAEPTTVSEEGMRWDLDHRPLAILDDLGVSNVIETPAARIACHEGTALVMEVGAPLLGALANGG